MPIRRGDHPGDDPRHGNKFIGKRNEGHHGFLVATKRGGKEAIVLAMTSSADPADG